MPHRGDHRPGAQGAEVGDEQKRDPVHEPAAGQRVAYQDQEQHEQDRHQDTHRPLQTGTYAAGDDEGGHDDENRVPGKQPLRVTDQGVEQGVGGLAGQGREGAPQGAKGVSDGPAGDDAVIGDDEKAGDYPAPADQLPEVVSSLLANEGAHGVDGALASAAPDKDLRHHDGDADHRYAQDIDQHKGAAPVLARDVRELPDVAQPDRRARGREYERQLVGPHAVDRSFRRHWLLLAYHLHGA